MPQLIRQIHMDLMRIDQAPGFVPQRIQLPFAVIADIHNARGLIHAPAFQEDRHEELAHPVGAGRQMRLFPCLYGVKEQQGISFIKCLICKTDQIGNNLPRFAVIDPLDRLIARVGYFFSIFR